MNNITQNIFFRERTTFRALPEIMQFMKPETLAQRIMFWCAKKLGMIKIYIPKDEVIQRTAIKIEGDDYNRISKAILMFMQNNPKLNPKKDLIILFGSEEYSRFLTWQSVLIRTDMEFVSNGHTFRGIEIRVVGYINGPLVIRREDLGMQAS